MRTRVCLVDSSPLVGPPRPVHAPVPWTASPVGASEFGGRGPNRLGTLRLTTPGRRTNEKRSVIVGYLEDGLNLVTMAINVCADGEPAWWLNLQAHPNARLDLADGPRSVTAHAAG